MKELQLPFPPAKILSFIRKQKESFWLHQREKNALTLFQRAAREVPAYKDFLKKNGISPKKIKSWIDFQNVPPMNKKNYLRQYPAEALHWGGTIDKPMVFTATSGSTGEPFYFSRNHVLDWQYSILAQLYLENSSYGRKPTLLIVCFGMGVWIGGLITYKAFEIASQRIKYPLSIITPGINKAEIFAILRKLAPHYHQTILAGYPPFLKDILDESHGEGIDIKKLHIRTLFAAEAFTEKFRDYIVNAAHIPNPMLDTLNIYGTADIGAMAYETPTSIFIRRIAVKNQNIFSDLFPSVHQKTPTLAQYNPLFITFETQQGEILLTGDNTVPLIRYAVGDHGGVYTFKNITTKLKKFGIELSSEIRKEHLEQFLYELPFVYVYERKDFSTTLYGLQIYPETIREALLAKPLTGYLTGKFTMLTKFNRRQNQYLEIHIELKKGTKASNQLAKTTREKIVGHLLVKNSEFRELHRHLGRRAIPKLFFWESEHPTYFKVGIKQKWITL